MLAHTSHLLSSLIYGQNELSYGVTEGSQEKGSRPAISRCCGEFPPLGHRLYVYHISTLFKGCGNY